MAAPEQLSAPPPPPPQHDVSPEFITVPSLLLAAALMFASFFAASRALGLQLERGVVVAAVRCASQLSLLGYVLVPIFRLDAPPLSFAWTILMVSVAALEAAARPALRYPTMRVHVLLTIMVAAFLSLFWGLLAVLRVGMEARYVIPLMGMLLGNTSSAVAVALGAVTTGLHDGAAAVEARLALGANRWEATQAVLRNAVTLGLTPVLNGMSIMGLVSIPGMMTGQILGGTAPSLAARYQIAVMLLIGTSAVISVTGSATLAVHACTDRADRLHVAELTKRPSPGSAGDPLRIVAARATAAVASARAWLARRRSGGAGGDADVMQMQEALLGTTAPAHQQ